eukprot:352598-Chlamydomonas_euryale.AAC.25
MLASVTARAPRRCALGGPGCGVAGHSIRLAMRTTGVDAPWPPTALPSGGVAGAVVCAIAVDNGPWPVAPEASLASELGLPSSSVNARRRNALRAPTTFRSAEMLWLLTLRPRCDCRDSNARGGQSAGTWVRRLLNKAGWVQGPTALVP